VSAEVLPPWRRVTEKGATLGIEILVVIGTLLGRQVARVLLRLVAAWYVLVHASVRRASRAYLVRILGRATLADVYRHVFSFAQVTFDRLFMVRGDYRPFEITCHGREHLRGATDARRGAVLILAHLGSFEVMRSISVEQALPINVLGYFRNATRLNAALRRINPAVDARLIEIRPGDPTFILEVEDRIAAGELVGTMGDRVGHDGKAVMVPFLGSEAPFPTGPYLLAGALRCPVYLAFGLYREPNRYELWCEPFAERIELPRVGREDALRALATRFAERVEHHCRVAPLNWFNFYDFWSKP
jgi:predicted LPLAT superfamily acyltransferase